MYSHTMEEQQLEHFSGAPEQAFYCTVFVNVKTKDKALDWLRCFSDKTKTTYYIARGSKVSGCRILFKTERICQHKQKSPQEPIKSNSYSISGRKLIVLANSHLKFTFYDKSKNKFPFNKTHRGELKLLWSHNHPLESAHALSFRPIANETTERFNHYFQLGHSASSARHYHIQNPQIENTTDNLQEVLADRSINPNDGDVQRAFRAWREKNYGKDRNV